MNGPMRRMARLVFLGFGLLLGALTWFQVLGADGYRSDPRNVRTAINISGKERGLIVTGDGTVLARSDPDPADPQAFVRTYPEGPAFAHVAGYTSRLVGESGLEAAYRDELRSRRDLTISDVIAALFGRDLRPENLLITIDAELQRAAVAALDGQRGAVVAIEPNTGAILAYVSSPSYDPNLFLGPSAVANRQSVLDDPNEPIRDRAGTELYPPGSVFKAVVAASAVESGIAGPETMFEDPVVYQLPGSTATIGNADGGPCGDGVEVTLQAALVRSCNTVFAALSVRLGADAIGETASSFGFDRRIDFPWALAESTFPASELAGDPAALAQSGIGERDVRVTPLQMALVAAAIANAGEVPQPYVVSQVFDADGDAREVTEPRLIGRAMSPATAVVLQQMMERVVTSGTGQAASIAGVRVAGKTGTALPEPGQPDVWFIGFAPVDAPQIAIAVMLEDGGPLGESGTGGSVAAPVAGTLMERYLVRGDAG
jgi:peptidoglycan glycosyltransferase